MTEYNFNHKRPYKKASYSELHQIKNDIGIRSEHRSYAEAEISYRQGRPQRLALIIAIIALLVTLIINFGPWMVKKFIKLSPWPQSNKKTIQEHYHKEHVTIKNSCIHNNSINPTGIVSGAFRPNPWLAGYFRRWEG